jgi:predicted  nucleic acid-binding Zn-ribbon protein
MTEGADLYRLQGLDSERDEKQRRLAEVKAALGESKALIQARQAVQSAQAQARAQARRQRDLELEVAGLTDKITGAEQRLYSGVIKNPKELADLQAEVAALRRWKQKLEDDLLEAMVEREDADAVHTQAQQHLDQTQTHWSTQQAALVSEQEALQETLQELEQARAALLPSIGAGDLVTYEALRRRKGGVAVARVSEKTCGECGVAISPSLEWHLRQGQLTHCGNCERILVKT